MPPCEKLAARDLDHLRAVVAGERDGVVVGARVADQQLDPRVAALSAHRRERLGEPRAAVQRRDRDGDERTQPPAARWANSHTLRR